MYMGECACAPILRGDVRSGQLMCVCAVHVDVLRREADVLWCVCVRFCVCVCPFVCVSQKTHVKPPEKMTTLPTAAPAIPNRACESVGGYGMLTPKAPIW